MINLHYQKRYYDFLKSIPKREKSEQTHSHHIIPRCFGGSNNKTNLKTLTIREHFIAHWMLAKAYGDGKMWLAFRIMCKRFKDCSRVTSKMYEISEKERIKNCVGLLAGMVWADNRWMTSVEYNQNKDSFKHFNKGRITVIEKKSGKTLKINCKDFSDEYTYIKEGKVNVFDREVGKYVEISKVEFGLNRERYYGANRERTMVFEILTGKTFYVSSEEYLKNKGTKYLHAPSMKTGTCPHCGTYGKLSGLKRWHFENCRNKEIKIC